MYKNSFKTGEIIFATRIYLTKKCFKNRKIFFESFTLNFSIYFYSVNGVTPIDRKQKFCYKFCILKLV